MSQARHPAALPDEVLLTLVSEQRFKGSGPGGQRRNKVETGVRLTHRPSGLTATASERRARRQNHDVALQRLRRVLALELRMPVDPSSHTPSPTWLRRTGGSNLAVNPGHPDVPELLAEALDVLAALDDDLPGAAQVLGVSSSRLVKLLKLEAQALTALNARLSADGRSTWR
jgi:hypothetical protein